ncbi:Uncharacterized protein APZ42_024044 [Daphnia magna]|jgi:hypothetical protein
MRVG